MTPPDDAPVIRRRDPLPAARAEQTPASRPGHLHHQELLTTLLDNFDPDNALAFHPEQALE